MMPAEAGVLALLPADWGVPARPVAAAAEAVWEGTLHTAERSAVTV